MTEAAALPVPQPLQLFGPAMNKLLPCVVLLFASAPHASAGYVYVNSSGMSSGGSPAYTTIQAAVLATSGQTTIIVEAGQYNENVTIDRDDVYLSGAQAGLNPLVGRSGSESVLLGSIRITGSRVAVDGLTVSANAQAAIWTTGADSVVRNNVVNSTVYGVLVGPLGGPTGDPASLAALVENNVITTGNSNIAVFNSTGTTVRGNYLQMSPDQFGSGIDIYFSDNNTITGNVINDAPTPSSPWFFSAIRLRGSHGNLVESNVGERNGGPAIQEAEGSDGNTIRNNFEVTAVPEPSGLVLALTGIGGGGLVWLRRRRRKPVEA